MKLKLQAGLTVLCVFSFLSCTHKNDAPQGSQGSVKSAQTVREVHLGVWSNLISPETLAEFEKLQGVRVVVSNYSSNEELLAKIQAGGAKFDVVVPTDYMVASLAKLGLIRKLEADKIPNGKNLNPRFLKKAYDPNNEYSRPLDLGTTGIAVNRELYQGQVRGYKDLFEKPDLAGKVAFLDDVREVIGAALKSLGYSLNTRDPKQLEQAGKLLRATRKRVKLYSSEALMTLTQGEAAVTQAFLPDALQARVKMNGKVDYVLPIEGGTFWIDNLVIPTAGEHVADAHALINFLLEPRVAVNSVQRIFVAPTSQAAMALLPAEMLGNRVMFPSDQDLAKFEMLEDLGDSLQLWDRIWTEVKAGGD